MPRCVTVAPGGWRGFYMLGAMCFIKHFHYLDDLLIGGASAGAHVAVYALSSRSDEHIVKRCITPLMSELADPKSRKNFVHNVARVYNDADLDIAHERAFTSITSVGLSFPPVANKIESSFETSEALIESVIRSSFVPMIFGPRVIRSKRSFHVDGAVTYRDQGPVGSSVALHVSPSTFGRDLSDVPLFDFDPTSVKRLIRMGFDDASRHPIDLPTKELVDTDQFIWDFLD